MVAPEGSRNGEEMASPVLKGKRLASLLPLPPLRGRLGWGVIEGRDDETAFHRANMAHIEIVATPHPSLPLKGGGDKMAK